MNKRFSITREVEKRYGNVELHSKDSIKKALNLTGKIKANFIKLAQKHPEYFANPKEAEVLSTFILQNATFGLPASEKRFALIIAPLRNMQKEFGALVLRSENINNEHYLRSVILMDKNQVDLKISKAKEQGEPILQF